VNVRLPIRVGVVGHRPRRLQFADLPLLSERLHELLAAVRTGVDRAENSDGPNSPVEAVSPLAEGTDRLFARAALDLGFALFVPMPFPQAEFERDFGGSPAPAPSLEEFRAILSVAAGHDRLTRLELHGDPADRVAAYAACTRFVLDHSRLLFLVWDGRREGRRGGTEEAFDEARVRHLPAVWIDAVAPHTWELLNASTTGVRIAAPRMAPAGGSALSVVEDTVRHLLDRH
jgi:hypothetical protein